MGTESAPLPGGELPRAILFTTAHDEHAIRAFEFNALDSLLKPFSEARFQKALQRARQTTNTALPGRVRAMNGMPT